MGDDLLKPKLSVIVVTYNRANLLPRALNSILNQSLQDFELILVNNGSTDSTSEICQEYVKKDGRIKLLTIAKNQGAARGRNAGIDRVQSPFLIMVDDDDYCESTMLSHLYDLITRYQADIAITGCVDEYSDGSIVPRYVYEETFLYNRNEGVSEFLKREKFHTAPGTKLFRTALFKNIRFVPDTRVDDIHVIYKLFVKAQKVVCHGLPEFHFCKHASNMTGFLSGDILRPDVLDDYLQMQDERVAYISKALPALSAQVRYAKYSYMISMVEKIKKGLSQGCETHLKFMEKVLYDNRIEFLSSPWITTREKNLMNNYIIKEKE